MNTKKKKKIKLFLKGTCLTVTEYSEKRDNFKVNIAPETIRKTNLGKNLFSFFFFL